MRRRDVLAGASAGAAMLAARHATAQGAGQGAEIRLGALYPFSGPLALLGDESFRGFEIAAEERNAAGGIGTSRIRFIKGDAVDQNQAIGEARRLMGVERVQAIFGTYASPPAFAATQVSEVQGVAYLELGALFVAVGVDTTLLARSAEALAARFIDNPVTSVNNNKSVY